MANYREILKNPVRNLQWIVFLFDWLIQLQIFVEIICLRWPMP